MEVGLQDLSNTPVRITSKARGVLKKIYLMLRDISEDPERHGKLQALITYDLTNPQLREKGKAGKLACEVRREFGRTPDVAGFRFLVSRSDDLTKEYLSVVYKPEWADQTGRKWKEHVAFETARRKEKYRRSREKQNGST
jgi:hypothetical protein